MMMNWDVIRFLGMSPIVVRMSNLLIGVCVSSSSLPNAENTTLEHEITGIASK